MMRKWSRFCCVFALVLAVMGSPVRAVEFFDITDIGTSASMIGRGHVRGFASGPSVIFENPAGLYRVPQYAGSFFTTNFMNEVYYNAVAVSWGTEYGKFGLGVMTSQINGVPVTGVDAFGEFVELSTFSNTRAVAKLGYQNSYNNIHFGVNYSYAYQELFTDSGIGHNADIGLIFDYDWAEVSFAMKNIMARNVEYKSGAEEDLNTRYVLGARLTHGDFSGYPQLYTSQGKLAKSFGLEYHPEFLPFMVLRTGYREFLVLDQVRNAMTYGVGLVLDNLEFDYAYEHSDHLDRGSKSFFSVHIYL